MTIERTCPQCKIVFAAKTGNANRADKIGAPLYCDRTCAGLARRLPVAKTKEQKISEKAAYDREYRARKAKELKTKKAIYYQRTRNPEKEKITRQERMPAHVEYCRQPAYKAKKSAYDRKRQESFFLDFGEAWRLLQELEKEVRQRATAYERRVMRGYYLRARGT